MHWDHPRTCGENFDFLSTGLIVQGSPPHLRGKHHFRKSLYARERITPAPAGKTYQMNIPAKELEGSPPHLRGKPLLPKSEISIQRITPAPAGKTLSHNLLKQQNQDHPRTCGENHTHICTHRHADGSPPHLRGKH